MNRIAKDSYLVEDRVGDLGNFPKTLTQQHFAEEVDVNNIVDRALKTGLLGDPFRIEERAAVFADVSSIGDYATALNRIIAAQQAFLELPVDLRARFGNDPAALLAFMAKPENLDECVKLGLLVKREEPAPASAPEPAPASAPEPAPAG